MKPFGLASTGLLPLLLAVLAPRSPAQELRLLEGGARASWQVPGGPAISADRFRRDFGPAHRFRMQGRSTPKQGRRPVFLVEGLTFSLDEELPDDWFDNWFEDDDDDMYLEESGGGYVLRNPHRKPDRIAVTGRPR